jgi:hypothetical protein
MRPRLECGEKNKMEREQGAGTGVTGGLRRGEETGWLRRTDGWTGVERKRTRSTGRRVGRVIIPGDGGLLKEGEKKTRAVSQSPNEPAPQGPINPSNPFVRPPSWPSTPFGWLPPKSQSTRFALGNSETGSRFFFFFLSWLASSSHSLRHSPACPQFSPLALKFTSGCSSDRSHFPRRSPIARLAVI